MNTPLSVNPLSNVPDIGEHGCPKRTILDNENFVYVLFLPPSMCVLAFETYAFLWLGLVRHLHDVYLIGVRDH